MMLKRFVVGIVALGMSAASVGIVASAAHADPIVDDTAAYQMGCSVGTSVQVVDTTAVGSTASDSLPKNVPFDAQVHVETSVPTGPANSVASSVRVRYHAYGAHSTTRFEQDVTFGATAPAAGSPFATGETTFHFLQAKSSGSSEFALRDIIWSFRDLTTGKLTTERCTAPRHGLFGAFVFIIFVFP